MAERAVSLEGGNADYITELGYELMMQGRVKDAMKCYRNAMKQDETSVTALTGNMFCTKFRPSFPVSLTLMACLKVPYITYVFVCVG